MIDLSGRSAVVTGGSRGIGRAIAILLARSGARVTLGYRVRATAARNDVDDAERIDLVCEQREGPLVVVVVTGKDDVHAVLVEERGQVRTH